MTVNGNEATISSNISSINQEQIPTAAASIGGAANASTWQEAQNSAQGTFRTMNELKQKAPKVYEMIVKSLITNFLRQNRMMSERYRQMCRRERRINAAR